MLIYPELEQSIANNINGPSLIKLPDWIKNPLGRYYLYFADHHGGYIRLAYADRIAGPWQIYLPGSLQLDQTPCSHHIASPDVRLDQERKKIVMYYHGPVLNIVWQEKFSAKQLSFYAESDDGLHFVSDQEPLAKPYLRVFQLDDLYYGLGMPGYFYQSKDGRRDFRLVKRLFSDNMRHSAVLVQDKKIYVFYTDVADLPEHIICCQLLGESADKWYCGPKQDLLYPDLAYEGGDLPLKRSTRGPAPQPVRQLRDPAIYVEGERVFLLYSVQGEFGIALAELFLK